MFNGPAKSIFSEYLGDGLVHAMELTREYEDDPVLSTLAKVMEHMGELSKSTNFELGYIQHKKHAMYGTQPIFEIADVINTLMGLLSQLYPDKSTDDLAKELRDAIEWKLCTYKRHHEEDTVCEVKAIK